MGKIKKIGDSFDTEQPKDLETNPEEATMSSTSLDSEKMDIVIQQVQLLQDQVTAIEQRINEIEEVLVEAQEYIKKLWNNKK